MAGRYVCGTGLEAEWSDDGGDDVEDEREVWMEDEKRTERAEVAIVDIAKPMRPRGELCYCHLIAGGNSQVDDNLNVDEPGPKRDYEVVDTVRRVIVLDDDNDSEEWEPAGDVEDDWEPIEETAAAGRLSYATILRRQKF